MAFSKENLVEEIISNARRDRKRLEACADGLTHGFNSVGSATEEGLDPEVAAAFAEEIAGISDALTNINKQLVELVKMEKSAPAEPPSPTKLTPDEIADAYEQIKPSEVN